MTEAPTCPPKDALVTALYGEAPPDERQRLDRHLAACAACRDEYEALGALRLALQEWETPAMASHVRLVSEPGAGPDAPAAVVVAGPARWWASRGMARAALAAAATLVLGISAGLANLDVTIGPQGLSVKTGRGHAASVPAEPDAAVAPSLPAAQVAALAPTESPADPGAIGVAEWRAELAALERRLRADMDARVAGTPGPTVSLAAARTDNTALLRQVQELIDAAETRQQRNLAQRVTELAREFDVQRRTDLVTIQQGLGQLEGRTQAEAARTRELMNLIVRTSGGAQR